MSLGIAVYDASPIIVFYQIAQLELLRALFDHAGVPIVIARDVAPSLRELPSWIEVHQVFTIPVISPSLDAGERAAIALAVQHAADVVVLDDLAGRKAAKTVGLTATGSLALLVRAKRATLIREVRP